MLSESVFVYECFKASQEQHSLPPSELSAQQKSELEAVVKRKLAIESAVLRSPEAVQVKLSKSYLDDAFDKVQMRYQQTEEFVADLRAMGLDKLDFRQALEHELQLEAIMDFVCADCEEVSDTELGLFYYMNSHKFVQPELRHASHILITVNEDSLENKRAQALEKIQQIERRLIKSPNRFSEQALKHSECPTALEGGKLGQIRKGVLYAELEEPLFSMQPGQLSSIVESPLGFHLLYCEQIRPEKAVAFDELKDKLRASLIQRKRSSKERKWLAGLMKKQLSDKHNSEIKQEQGLRSERHYV